ncbi:hypothetical protein BMF94_1346 [Rhodotorula taiwanensis]|uniref:Autophagy-related protein 4 n=1 Tax=Rhodotorula taiwanensis TaxID=741276 RepID=A0A2S5BG45_9BASI|nr:hypothetical protein BMF94_1346 [Rhodotorula taiwanensis]
MASAAATRPPPAPLSVVAPHPPHASPQQPPPSKIPRSRSANSLALFRTRSSGFEARLDNDEPGPANERGGIRRVGSYESTLSASPPSPEHDSSGGGASERHAHVPAGTATSTPLPRANGKFAKWLSRSIGPGSGGSPGPQADSISNLNDTIQPSKEVPSKNGRPRRSMSIGALDLVSLQPSNTSPASTAPVQSPAAAAAFSAPSISISSSPFAPQPGSSAALPPTAATTTTTVAGRSRRLLPLGVGGGLRADAAGANPDPSQEVPSDSSGGGAIKKKRFGGKRSQSSGMTLNSAQYQGDDVGSSELRISSSRSSSASGSTTRTTTTTTTSGSVGRASVGSATRDPFAFSSSSSSAATGGAAAEGRLARGLRKTRSGLKLFGRARDQEAGAATSAQSSSTVERTQSSSHRPSIGSTESLASASTATGDAESIRELQQRELQPPLASSNRLGGWFTSLIPSANATTDAGSPDKARRAAADQGTPGRTRGGSAPAATGSPTPASPARRAGQLSSSSPLKKGSSSSASIGGGGGRLGPFDRMLDRAVQYFLDSDANTDRCEDDIWLLGVRHDGWREDAVDDEDADRAGGKRSRSPVKARAPAIPARGDENDVFAAPASTTIHGWPATFYRDFYSRVGLTYRSGFPVIECEPPASPANGAGGVVHGMLSNLSMSIGRGAQRFANVAAQADSSEPRGLSSDTGWGCMLRTGQSLLANALVKVHLGRDWRRPLPASLASTSSIPHAATYARILSLFLDDPSPLSPFSVHQFARQGKLLGKEIGEWFGPSTAAGAIKALVNAYEPAGIRVVSCVDGTVYESEVVEASLVDGQAWKRPVLVLVNVRLGLEGVNPIYHEAIKGIFRFPQSVGIAGGRPISSYYFVGSQADSLFYVDPHFPRPAIPLVLPTESDLVDSFASEPISASHPQLDEFLLRAYSDSAWATYHCDKVRKVALGNLDPSMLLGFVIENEADWSDFRARMQDVGLQFLPRVRQFEDLSSKTATMFTIAASPPAWLRRSASSAHAARTNATARTSLDDSFSVVGETDRDHDDNEVNSDGFSEPDDWELQSTDDEAMRSSAVEVRRDSPAADSALSRSPDDLVIVH